MIAKLSKGAYMELIHQDLVYLNTHCKDGGLELDHIKLIICKSIDHLYPENPESILTEAAQIRGGERNADYGDAVESFGKIARVANEMTGLTLTAADCCKVMMAVKIVRESYNHKRDNLVDLCGYADILYLIENKPFNT